MFRSLFRISWFKKNDMLPSANRKVVASLSTVLAIGVFYNHSPSRSSPLSVHRIQQQRQEEADLLSQQFLSEQGSDFQKNDISLFPCALDLWNAIHHHPELIQFMSRLLETQTPVSPHYVSAFVTFSPELFNLWMPQWLSTLPITHPHTYPHVIDKFQIHVFYLLRDMYDEFGAPYQSPHLETQWKSRERIYYYLSSIAEALARRSLSTSDFTPLMSEFDRIKSHHLAHGNVNARFTSCPNLDTNATALKCKPVC